MKHTVAMVLVLGGLVVLGMSMTPRATVPEEDHAVRYASALAACANGRTLNIGGRLVQCKVVRDR